MAVETTQSVPPNVEAAQLVMQAGTGYILSSALQVATTLEIAEKLASGPKTAAQLAPLSGVLEDPLYRVLRVLASVGIFREIEGKQFVNTPASEMLRKNTPGTMYSMARWMSEPMHFRVYADIMHSMTTGQPAFQKTTGKPVFEYMPNDPEMAELFNDAMTTFSQAIVPGALKAYDFSGIDVLVDVAGGHGGVLLTVLKQYPKMRGILMDLDHVIAGARPKIASAGLSGRCEAVAGDFFKAVPQGDAYIMKHIIHDWDDERASMILRNIRTALGHKSDGRVILLESVIRPGNEPDLGKLVDLEMLAYPGGRERTAEEYRQLFARSGFNLTRIVPTESPLSVVEARPA
jgi:hypothetical protein